MKEFFKRFGKSDIQNALGFIIVTGCFILLYMLMYKPIPAENKEIMTTTIGYLLGSALTGVVGFYYGASKKTDTTVVKKTDQDADNN